MDVDVDGVQGRWQEDPLPFAVDGGVLHGDKEREEQAQGASGGPAQHWSLQMATSRGR